MFPCCQLLSPCLSTATGPPRASDVTGVCVCACMTVCMGACVCLSMRSYIVKERTYVCTCAQCVFNCSCTAVASVHSDKTAADIKESMYIEGYVHECICLGVHVSQYYMDLHRNCIKCGTVQY